MKKWGVLIVVSLAVFIIAIDTTMMSVAITRLAQDLNTEVQNIQMAIAIYSLVMAASMLVGGKLATMFGAKRIFVIGMILYCVGTTIAALATNVIMLTAGWSVIEGIGAAFMMPAVMSFLMITYKGKDRVKAFAVYAAILVGGAAIGPIIGGIFTEFISWRWAFGMEAFIGVAVLANQRVLVGLERADIMPKLDWGGIALSSSGLILLVAGVININIPLIVIGSIVLVLFFLWERRQESKGNETLVPTSLFKNRFFMSATLTNLVIQICLGAILFIIPWFLQTMLFANAFDTGLAMMPLTLLMMALTFITARLIARVSIKYLTIIGIAVMIGGIILTASLFDPAMTIMSLAPGLAVIGVGMGLAVSQIGNLTLSAAKPEETNEASGLHNTFMNLGRSIGTAAVGTLMLFFFLSSITGGINSSAILPEQNKTELTAIVTEVSEGMESENLEAEVEETLGSYPDEYITELKVIKDHSAGDSMRQTFYVLAGVMGAGLVISLFVSKEKLDTKSGTK
jgi:EmrB/QacA subfamily drug resistance transporter